MQIDAAARASEPVPGLRLRPYAGEADVPDMVRIKNAEWAANGIVAVMSVGELAAELRHPSDQLDPSRDVRIAELDGRMVGFAQSDWVDTTDGLREYRSGGAVDPEFQRRGIGTALLRDRSAAAHTLAASHDTDRAKVLGMWVDEKNAGGLALARLFGYTEVRRFYEMERPIDGELPEVPDLPIGIEVRAVTADQARAIWDADHDAFRDHWGGFEDSDASFHRWLDSPEFEPSLMVVAWDGGEITAAVLNAIYREENERLGIRRGWLESVFTRRRWRRMGLARALIVRSFHLLRERGLAIAVLGVDADNPSGAVALYESVGFSVTERSIAWRKPLEVPNS